MWKPKKYQILFKILIILVTIAYNAANKDLQNSESKDIEENKNQDNIYYSSSEEEYVDEYDDSSKFQPSSGIVNRQSINSETIPDPERLVVPGYHLPDHLFNEGKPFYVEKDPFTDNINFDAKAPQMNQENNEEEKYSNNENYQDIFKKENIDRKDGGIVYTHHRTSNELTQLTPMYYSANKYQSKKYEVPLISSSYSNTKIQGSNKNSISNSYNSVEQDYKATTFRPNYFDHNQKIEYYTPKQNNEYSKYEFGNNVELNFEENQNYKSKTTSTTTTSTTSTTTTTTTKPSTEKITTPKPSTKKPSTTTIKPTVQSKSTTMLKIITTKMPTTTTQKPTTTIPTTTKSGGFFEDFLSVFNLDQYEEKFDDEEISNLDQYPNNEKDENQYNNDIGSIFNEPENITNNNLTNLTFQEKNEKINNLKEIETSTVKLISTSSKYKEIIRNNSTSISQSLNQNKLNETKNNNSKDIQKTYVEPKRNKTVNIYTTTIHPNYYYVPVSPNSHAPQYYYQYEDYYDDPSNNFTMPEIKKETSSINPISTTKQTTITTKRMQQNENSLNLTNEINEKQKPSNNELFYNDDLEFYKTSTLSPDIKKDQYLKSNTENIYKHTSQTSLSTTIRPVTTSPTTTTIKPTQAYIVTSLPLDSFKEQQPIIALTQNLKEKLNSERVDKNEMKYSTSMKLTPDFVPLNYDKYNNSFKININEYEVNENENKTQSKKENIDVKDKTSLYENNKEANYHPYSEKLINSPTSNQENYDFYSHDVHKPLLIPNKSNIRIPPNKDTMSFIVGNHQSVGGGHFIGSAIHETPYIESNAFKPIYNKEEKLQQTSVNMLGSIKVDNSISFGKPNPNIQIQPIIGSEASLSIGSPPGEIKVKPGKVMDEKIEFERPLNGSLKMKFPDNRNENSEKNKQKNDDSKLFIKQNYQTISSNYRIPLKEVPIRGAFSHPPWDPRPGHFHKGNPEYSKQPSRINEQYKRKTTGEALPNILPQFRPNVKISHNHQNENIGTIPHMRQPLLERPHRPINYYEKMYSSAFHGSSHNRRNPPPEYLRKVPDSNNHPSNESNRRILNFKDSNFNPDEQFGFLNKPPQIPPINHIDGDEREIATLQMLQFKQNDDVKSNNEIKLENKTENPLYVVYPVNSKLSNMNILNTIKETVTISVKNFSLPTREDEDPLLKPKKDENYSPVYPMKNEFPYYIEKPETFSDIENSNKNMNSKNEFKNTEIQFQDNQWNSINSHDKSEENLISDNEIISTKLKTNSDKPIANVYTPTEPNTFNSPPISYVNPNFEKDISKYSNENNDRYNYYQVDNLNKKEFTVNTMFNTDPHSKYESQDDQILTNSQETNDSNSKFNLDMDTFNHESFSLGFQAPFQASTNIDSPHEGWSVINTKKKQEMDDRLDLDSTILETSTAKFDIENFKPTLFGGFKPIYNTPESDPASINDREEK